MFIFIINLSLFFLLTKNTKISIKEIFYTTSITLFIYYYNYFFIFLDFNFVFSSKYYFKFIFFFFIKNLFCFRTQKNMLVFKYVNKKRMIWKKKILLEQKNCNILLYF